MKELAFDESGFKRRIERYSPKQDVIDYGFICSTKKYQVSLHYIEQAKKTIHCMESGECCADLGSPTNYTIYLVGIYTDYKDPEAPISLQYLRCTKALDESIKALAQQFENPKELCGIDLQLYLDTSVGIQYKRVGVTPCINGKRKATKKQLEDLKKVIEVNLPYLETEIANVVTPEEYRKLMSNSSPAKPIPKTQTKSVPANQEFADNASEVQEETEIDISDIDELL